MVVNLPMMSEIFQQAIWPMFRVSTLIMTMPLMNTKWVPTRIKAILVILLALFLINHHKIPHIPIFSMNAIPILLKELVLGAIIGFSLQFLFQIFLFLGDLLAMQSGLSFASLVDHSVNSNISVVSQFFNLMALLLFISFDGHLLIMEILLGSYNSFPLSRPLAWGHFYELAKWGSWIYLQALKIGLPIVIALLLVSMTLGVATRAIPQLNVFSLGMPISLLFIIFLIWATLSDMHSQYQQLETENFRFGHHLLKDW